jgi:hypothetical protein
VRARACVRVKERDRERGGGGRARVKINSCPYNLRERDLLQQCIKPEKL